jgi:hypothetical protein
MVFLVHEVMSTGKRHLAAVGPCQPPSPSLPRADRHQSMPRTPVAAITRRGAPPSASIT